MPLSNEIMKPFNLLFTPNHTGQVRRPLCPMPREMEGWPQAWEAGCTRSVMALLTSSLPLLISWCEGTCHPGQPRVDPSLGLPSCMSPSKSLTPLKPQFHRLWNGDGNTDMARLWQGLGMIWLRGSAWRVAGGQQIGIVIVVKLIPGTQSSHRKWYKKLVLGTVHIHGSALELHHQCQIKQPSRPSPPVHLPTPPWSFQWNSPT